MECSCKETKKKKSDVGERTGVYLCTYVLTGTCFFTVGFLG